MVDPPQPPFKRGEKKKLVGVGFFQKKLIRQGGQGGQVDKGGEEKVPRKSPKKKSPFDKGDLGGYCICSLL